MPILTILNGAQVVVSILLVGAVLLQQRGGGLSPVFGGEGGTYRTRRGVEKGIFIATIILGVLFFVLAIIHVLLKNTLA